MRGSSFDDLGDVDAVVSGDVLVPDAARDAEAQTCGRGSANQKSRRSAPPPPSPSFARSRTFRAFDELQLCDSLHRRLVSQHIEPHDRPRLLQRLHGETVCDLTRIHVVHEHDAVVHSETHTHTINENTSGPKPVTSLTTHQSVLVKSAAFYILLCTINVHY